LRREKPNIPNVENETKSSQIHTELSVLAQLMKVVVLEYKTRGQNKTRFEAKLHEKYFTKGLFNTRSSFFSFQWCKLKAGWKFELRKVCDRF